MAPPPGVDQVKRSRDADLGLPPGIARQLGIISDINQLIARPALIAYVFHTAGSELFDHCNQLKQRDGVFRPAADIENLATATCRMGTHNFKGMQQVIDTKHVSYL